VEELRVHMVEVPRRFVREHDRRVDRQRPRDRRALLLTAGELGRPVGHTPPEADPREQFLSA
jgi:hypothetical protein